VALLLLLPNASAEVLRLASYNVENYVDEATGTRRPKSAAAKAKVKENILALKPDVVALQEMGRESALRELQTSLKSGGLDLPYLEHVKGWDTNIFVAVLSRFPIVERRSHTNESFLLNGRRFQVSRGFAEVEIKVSDKSTFTLFTAHLKSKRAVAEADEAELRLEEARLLRAKITARLEANPGARIAVLGDFNDNKDSASTRAVIGRGKFKLIDTRPAELNGDNQPNENPAWEPRNITWTHHFGKEDSYSRIDFLLISPAMAQGWQTNKTQVLAVPNWGVASDHRPIMATFELP
jgi:endonuclease/exonuclease/phosphatase family metal-dependent hydrolase